MSTAHAQAIVDVNCKIRELFALLEALPNTRYTALAKTKLEEVQHRVDDADRELSKR